MDEIKIAILGKTGTGKSSVADTILGDKMFQIGDTGISETSECQSETRCVYGGNVTLIDTPGLFDTDQSEEDLKAEIVKCITECSPGPHAFLIAFNVAKFTNQEQEVINKINQYFSEEAFKYATVLFTHGDQLKDGQTIEQYFHNNHLMSDLMKKCGGRCHVVDNKHWKNNQPDDYRSNQFQVKQLMKTINYMIEANNGSCYTNEVLQAVEKLRQVEEEKIRQLSGNKTEDEIREKAKKRVFKRLLINLVCGTTCAMLGALFGGVRVVGGATGSVMPGDLLKAIKKGYSTTKEAHTATEAIVRAANAVCNEVKLFTDQEKTAENKSESKPLIGPDS